MDAVVDKDDVLTVVHKVQDCLGGVTARQKDNKDYFVTNIEC